MGKNNTEQLNIAKKYLGKGGSKFRKFCGLPSGSAWCDAFVTTIFAEAGNSSLFCNGTKQTYCPTTIKWCRKNLAEVPPYLALPSDIIFFDWEPNSVPNHIGFVRERKDCEAIYTIEGNTSGGIVANKLRNTKYVCGIYRPHFKATYKIGKLTVDGYFGYNSIAMLQKALGQPVDGILGQGTVKALQRKCGASADGLWGKATSKAVQKWLGVKVDGYFGPNSVKALQRWINKATSSSPSVKTKGDKIADSAKSYVGKVKYVLGGKSLKTGVDCTGFVQAIYGLHGIKLDNKLSDWGKSIGTDLSKAQRGDILTFKNKSTGKVCHHAIYDGNGYCVHAANPKQGVIKSKVSAVGQPIEGIRRRWK